MSGEFPLINYKNLLFLQDNAKPPTQRHTREKNYALL